MAVSQEILLEYDEIATRKFGVASVYAFRELLTNLPNVELYKTYFQWNFIVADPDDNKFVDLAIAANAQLLVTEDKHFRVLKKVAFPKITLANADEFVRLLATDQFQ